MLCNASDVLVAVFSQADKIEFFCDLLIVSHQVCWILLQVSMFFMNSGDCCLSKQCCIHPDQDLACGLLPKRVQLRRNHGWWHSVCSIAHEDLIIASRPCTRYFVSHEPYEGLQPCANGRAQHQMSMFSCVTVYQWISHITHAAYIIIIKTLLCFQGNSCDLDKWHDMLDSGIKCLYFYSWLLHVEALLHVTIFKTKAFQGFMDPFMRQVTLVCATKHFTNNSHELTPPIFSTYGIFVNSS